MFQIRASQEAHSGSTQRLSSSELEQKNALEVKVIDFSFLSKVSAPAHAFTHFYVGDTAIGNSGLYYTLWAEAANPRINGGTLWKPT